MSPKGLEETESLRHSWSNDETYLGPLCLYNGAVLFCMRLSHVLHFSELAVGGGRHDLAQFLCGLLEAQVFLLLWSLQHLTGLVVFLVLSCLEKDHDRARQIH